MSAFKKPTEEQIQGNIAKVKKAIAQLHAGALPNLSREEFRKIEKDLKRVLSTHEMNLELLIKERLE